MGSLTFTSTQQHVALGTVVQYGSPVIAVSTTAPPSPTASQITLPTAGNYLLYCHFNPVTASTPLTTDVWFSSTLGVDAAGTASYGSSTPVNLYMRFVRLGCLANDVLSINAVVSSGTSTMNVNPSDLNCHVDKLADLSILKFSFPASTTVTPTSVTLMTLTSQGTFGSGVASIPSTGRININSAGLYEISAMLGIDNVASAGFYLYVYVNSVEVVRKETGFGGFTQMLLLNYMNTFASGDFIEFKWYSTLGTATTRDVFRMYGAVRQLSESVAASFFFSGGQTIPQNGHDVPLTLTNAATFGVNAPSVNTSVASGELLINTNGIYRAVGCVETQQVSPGQVVFGFNTGRGQDGTRICDAYTGLVSTADTCVDTATTGSYYAFKGQQVSSPTPVPTITSSPTSHYGFVVKLAEIPTSAPTSAGRLLRAEPPK